MNRSVTVRAPAKVNLQLSVGPVGADGFHPLVTVFQAVSLFDEVTATPLPTGSGVRVEVSGQDAGEVPLGPENLAARAAAVLADRLQRPADVALRIDKAIPVAGGMAGGSADAAAALLACAHLWDPSGPRQGLVELAATLGSDVPFGLLGGTAIGTGRGDHLTPVPVHGQFHWVFATAHEGLSTPQVYRRFDEIAEQMQVEVPQPSLDERLLAALGTGDAAKLGASLSNGLQEAALSLRPRLRTVLQRGVESGALGALVSGSGPTCAFLVADGEAAEALMAALGGSGLCKGLLPAQGPVAGALVVDG